MLEKIGLPAKPSMRGSNWVVDASHCQGCSSQFTFINRKHHCRRCGGLFCNSCTQQKMVLRGQGDSPVRICEPCKKLEEAARFELRHGHKSRAGKGFSVGSSYISKKNEDEILSQLLRDDGKESFASGHQSDNRTFSSTRSTSSWASSSNIQVASIHDGLGEISRSHSAVEPNFVQNEMGSASPEELRQRASEEKNKYKILKGEGKPEDALKAFKRGKELERQAEAMEILIRKNRRKVTPPGNMVEIREKEAHTKGSGRNRKPLPQLSNEKVDLLAELKELGWSDMDIRDQDKKPGSTSLEGEMSSLSGETSQRNDNKKKVPLGIDKTQVVEHKKKALALKREGKLSEAKEELKKAKVLEKQLEEQELLAEAEDSDDEISALIRSMDNEEQSELSNPLIQEQHFDIEHLMGTTDDLDLDTNFEVTDDDIEDPEIAADLKSLGWTDDSDHLENVTPQSLAVNREALLSEILSLKREALSKKRTGNVADAMLHLKKAKLLERDLENLEPHTDNVMAGNSSTIQISSSTRTADKMSMPTFLDDGNVRGGDFNLTAKSRVTIQKELLNLKKKALALRREGKFDESEEELKKGKVLEHQLEEMDTTSKMKVGHMAFDGKGRGSAFEHSVTSQDLPVAEDREDVTDQDMHDPTYLSLLKSIGWNDGHDEPVGSTLEASIQNDKVSLETSKMTSCIAAGTSRRTKAEIQRELLGLKRKALALRREGKADDAEEVLSMSKALEDEMTEMDEAKKVESYRAGSKIGESPFGTVIEEVEKVATEEDEVVDDLGGDGANDEVQVQASTVVSKISSSAPLGEMEPIPDENASLNISASISPALVKQIKEKTEAGSMGCEKALSETGGDIVKTQEFLRKKGLASADKKTSRSTAEGRIGSYIHDSRIGVLVEVNEDMKQHVNETKSAPGNTSQDNQNVPRDTILSHKKKAVALKREGKLAEALEELRQAKLLEKSCQQDNPEKKKGLHDMPASTSNTPLAGPTRDSASNLAPKPAPGRDRFKLQQESLSHKRQALKLRREGRTQEAEAESELAKALEAQLEELAAHEPSKPSVSGAGLADDAVMEDFLDPQLLSALKALGLEDPNTAPQAPARLQRVTDVAEPAKPNVGKNENHSQERIQLEEQIKAEKLKALNLKRSGKQSEALDAFRRAKLLERKLNLLA